MEAGCDERLKSQGMARPTVYLREVSRQQGGEGKGKLTWKASVVVHVEQTRARAESISFQLQRPSRP